MMYCHTLVKYNQLFKGTPSFHIVSSLKFNEIGKKIIKFCAISHSTSFWGVSKGGLHMECKSRLASGHAVNTKRSLGSVQAWPRGTIFPKRCGITGKCYDCTAETLNVYFSSFLSLRKSLFPHTEENKGKSPRCWVPRFSSTCPRLTFGTDLSRGWGETSPKQKPPTIPFFIQILEQSREATPCSPKLSSSTPSPGLSNPFLLNSTSSIQMNVIITPAQQSSSLNYNTLPAPCAKSTSLSLFPH